MSYNLKEDDISKITEILGVSPEVDGNSFTWVLANPQLKQNIVLTVCRNITISEKSTGTVATVQSNHGYFEIHNITTFIPFDPDEIIFIHHDDQFLSSLIIGKGATCSLFSNIDRSILRKDLSELEPATLMAAMQLSIADSII
jgi:hypothetical protein